MTVLLRRLIPQLLVPLCMICGGLAATPWLHAFGSHVALVPVLGAAIISPLVPTLLMQRRRARSVWVTLPAEIVTFVVYCLAVVLQNAVGIDEIRDGFVTGPSQILTFALPLVSPRSLLIAPVALVWLAGAIAGECFARRWFTVLPYPAFLLSFGLAYAATARAGDLGTVTEAISAALLLLALLLLRVAQTWTRQDAAAESTQADGILPLRSAAVGAVTAAVVTLVAALAIQSGAFAGNPRAPHRVPPVDQTQPLSPVDLIASLRPSRPGAEVATAFTVTLDGAVPGYFTIADMDTYDGDGWSFHRTFVPSGGVIPADTDPNLQLSGPPVLQQYLIAPGPLARAPWMPYLNRPQRVGGLSVNIDVGTGMVVPTAALGAGTQYSVTSVTTHQSFADLPATATPDTGTAAQDTALPVTTSQRLPELIQALSLEVGVPTSKRIPLLQAVAADLRTQYALTGGTATPTPSTAPSSPATGSASPTASTSSAARAGSTAYSAVLSSIGQDRVGTPEQYATLVALIARQLGVPARLVTGFRLEPPDNTKQLPKGTYRVTTADAWTWVEIPIVGAGWVVLDATPSDRTAPQRRPSAAASATPSPSPTPSQNALVTNSNGGNAVAPPSTLPPSERSAPTTLIVVVIAVVAALLIALLIFLSVRKGRRRRRRQGLADPRRRTAAAWRESIDLLSEAGLPQLGGLTGEEIAGLAERQFGPDSGEHARFIGRAAGAAVYSTAVLVRPQDADDAWDAEKRLRHEVGRRLGLRGRLRAWLRYARDTPPAR